MCSKEGGAPMADAMASSVCDSGVGQSCKMMGVMPDRRWLLSYLVKATILMGFLYLTSLVLPCAPPIAAAAILAILSIIGATSAVYGWVMRKTLKQSEYAKEGNLAKLNEGRVICFAVCFVVSAASMVGLALESPKWSMLDWTIVVLAIPLYGLVWILVRMRLRREYAPLFLPAGVLKVAPLIVAVLLFVAFGLASVLTPPISYESAQEAFLAVNRAYSQSPSTLLEEVEYLGSLKDGLVGYGLSEFGRAASPFYLVFHIALYGFIFFGVANMLGVCALDTRELRRVFEPLQRIADQATQTRPIVRFAVLAAAMPLCFMGLFVVVDKQVSRAIESGELTPIQQFVRDQMALSVFVLDGEYYEYQAVQELVDQTIDDAEALRREARETLVPLINASFDMRIANVDSYLDWYYSLPADYERLGSIVTGAAESYLEEQLTARIEEGVDDSELFAQLSHFTDEADSLRRSFSEGMANSRFEGLPSWLFKSVTVLSDSVIGQSLAPTQSLMTASERFAVSGTAGVGAGLIAKKVAQRAVGKKFFQELVTRVGKVIGGRAIGSAAGGALGSIGGPAGAALGLAVGAGVGVGVDALLLNIDELHNRDAYRAELVDAIEQERAEMLALFEESAEAE